MSEKNSESSIGLFAADSLAVTGIVMGAVYLLAGMMIEAGIFLLIGIAGFAYSIKKGQYWPGKAVLYYWRHYL